MGSTVFGGVKITLFGHASLSFEFRGMNVYVDPYVLPASPKPADLILHTHSHFDHCVRAEKISKQNTVVIGHGCSHACRPIEIGEKAAVAGAIIEAVHAYNISKPFHPKGFGAGYIITFGAPPQPTRIYVAGDTDFIPETNQIKCDVACLPIGGKYTMDATEAARAAAAIKPKLAIPIHYNYLEDTKADANEFKRLCAEFGCACDVRILL